MVFWKLGLCNIFSRFSTAVLIQMGQQGKANLTTNHQKGS